MRILVTGSRDWPYPHVVYEEIGKAIDGKWDQAVIVHGACPTGTDRFAQLYAESRDCGIERYPADWTKHGKAAGFIRNQQMVDLGADLCLGFRLNGSHGTTDCLERALAARIPRRIIDLTITGVAA